MKSLHNEGLGNGCNAHRLTLQIQKYDGTAISKPDMDGFLTKIIESAANKIIKETTDAVFNSTRPTLVRKMDEDFSCSQVDGME